MQIGVIDREILLTRGTHTISGIESECESIIGFLKVLMLERD